MTVPVSRVQMAPLAGVTDIAFRLLAAEYGAELVYTEMVNVKGLYYNDPGSKKLLETDPSETRTGIQIFGRDIDIVERVIEDIINPLDWPVCLDFNLGCPAPKIVKNREGSFLMTEPKLVEKLIATVVKRSRFPVSAKFRLGFDEMAVNYLEIGKILESAGVNSITLHARTRDAYYSGKADWSAIAKLVKAVEIPVIGNGDIYSAADAERMLQETGCHGVMVARGALGNPFIFREIKRVLNGEEPAEVKFDERYQTLKKHYELVLKYKPERVAVCEMRKHAAWYLKGLRGSNTVRNTLNHAPDMESIERILEEYRDSFLTR